MDDNRDIAKCQQLCSPTMTQVMTASDLRQYHDVYAQNTALKTTYFGEQDTVGEDLYLCGTRSLIVNIHILHVA